ncbi:MAG: hypothetical protein II527_03140 [Bacteroidales bacterium]|nr:hypothetical protein [Bacteroidales bacterium]
MKKITNLNDMMEAFRHIFRDTEDRQDLVQVLRVLNDYFTLQEEVQKLPLRLRLKYWACTSVIFFYLQVHKQLGRSVGPFSSSVKKNIYKVMANIESYVLQKKQT